MSSSLARISITYPMCPVESLGWNGLNCPRSNGHVFIDDSVLSKNNWLLWFVCGYRVKVYHKDTQWCSQLEIGGCWVFFYFIRNQPDAICSITYVHCSFQIEKVANTQIVCNISQTHLHPRKPNMSPENGPFQKEHNLPSIIVHGIC